MLEFVHAALQVDEGAECAISAKEPESVEGVAADAQSLEDVEGETWHAVDCAWVRGPVTDSGVLLDLGGGLIVKRRSAGEWSFPGWGGGITG